MPLKKCSSNGKSGWQYGSGKCYTGPGAKKRAIKNGLAMVGPEKFKEEMAKSGLHHKQLRSWTNA